MFNVDRVVDNVDVRVHRVIDCKKVLRGHGNKLALAINIYDYSMPKVL